MAQSVKIKRPRRVPGWKLVLFAILFFGPVSLVAYCWLTDTSIHLAAPAPNLLAHAVIVGVPLLWGILLTCKPLQFEEGEEIGLGHSHYAELLRTDWWVSLVLWAAPLFVLAALGIDCVTLYLPQPEQLATSPGQAFVRAVIAFAMGTFYGVVLFEGVETRISTSGIRSGLTHFYEWENIHHVCRQGDIYSLHHQANPALPAASFRVRNDQTRAILDLFLRQFQIPVGSVGSKHLRRLQGGVVASFLILLGTGFVLRYQFQLALTWAASVVFLLGLGLSFGLERIRGVNKHTRQRPAVR